MQGIDGEGGINAYGQGERAQRGAAAVVVRGAGVGIGEAADVQAAQARGAVAQCGPVPSDVDVLECEGECAAWCGCVGVGWGGSVLAVDEFVDMPALEQVAAHAFYLQAGACGHVALEQGECLRQ